MASSTRSPPRMPVSQSWTTAMRKGEGRRLKGEGALAVIRPSSFAHRPSVPGWIAAGTRLPPRRRRRCGHCAGRHHPGPRPGSGCSSACRSALLTVLVGLRRARLRDHTRMMTYAESLYAALADRDPIAVFQETPARLRQLTTSVGDAALRRAEREGKWSMLQIAQHLADSELVVGWRYRLISAQDGAPVTAYDQDQWVSSLWRGDERLDDVLAQFEALRAANLRLLARLTPAQWKHA